MSEQLPNVDIWMTHPNLFQAPKFSLPAGYSMRFYRKGDIPVWVEIQQSADRFFEATSATFARSMPGETSLLSERVMFLLNAKSREVGTITAWQSSFLTTELIGQVHWVAIAAEVQGQGLAKPMLSAVCQRMIELGHTKACLSTNTRRIPALNLYLKFGFKPFFQNEIEHQAWEKIKPKLKY
jgi:GNAT superfamily N-acetyltransferase